MVPPPLTKAALRAEMLERRKRAALSGDGTGATEGLLRLLETSPRRTIAGYLPIRSEIDPVPAMTALAAMGHRLAVPAIPGRDCPLDWVVWEPECELVAGPFRTLLPKSGERCLPELLIVPLVAFDAQGNRLGYGGGYYDRSIAALGLPPTIGLAWDAQEAEAVPAEATDKRLDAIVTPTRTMVFSPHLFA